MRRTKEHGQRWVKRLGWLLIVVGGLIAAAGTVYAVLAPTAGATLSGVVAECVGLLVVLPGLHAVIEG